MKIRMEGWAGEHTDGQRDLQGKTIIPHNYHVAGYKNCKGYEIFFLFFPKNKVCLKETICMKCQTISSGKNKLNIISLLSAELDPRVLKNGDMFPEHPIVT